MNTENDKAKLTAYALGELGESERAEIEAQLAKDPAARQEIEEIRKVAEILSEELRAEPAPKLTDRQRQVVKAKTSGNKKPRRRLRIWIPLSAAALVLIAISAGVFAPRMGGPHGGKSGYFYYERASGRRNERWFGNESFRRRSERWNREAYDRIVDNTFRNVADHPLSTFSIDVDTASYANVRRLLNQGTPPPKGAVRIEEMINYFTYDYAGPDKDDKHPFAAHAAVAGCPWNAEHRLVRIAIKGREIAQEKRPSSNFVFLLDVSGSMQPANKLPLLKRAMKMLVDRLGENDRVAITVYAGAAGLVLDLTTCDQKGKILSALDRLHAGGTTAGAAGIRLAYKVAAENFIKGGVNRVILCTDGDFNVGVTDESELVRLIEDKAKSGVFLSVLGFGMGNYQDSRLEKLADKGNGNYAYIDTINEARKVLITQMSGTLITIAKDVKIQIEFNPSRVSAYRLIGYENRILAKEDFNDDKKDAGEIGAGHTVTALYEIVPAGVKVQTPSVDSLKYQTPARPTDAAKSNETLTLKLRYKKPDGDKSTLMEYPVTDKGDRFDKASADFRFAASVASFGMILRDSKYKGSYTLDAVIELAQSSKGADKNGYRAEFIQLVKTAKTLGKM